MSRKKLKPQPKQAEKIATPEKKRRIPWSAALIIIAILLVYAPSFSLGLTELDDIIFIHEHAAFNEDLSNVAHAFQRGVFAEKEDTYYRPLLLDSFIINAQVSGTSSRGFHVFNILLHIAAVLLLFLLLIRLRVPQIPAFMFSMLFGVHPALTQAVSWIPGRNDSLLAIFAFASCVSTLAYAQKGKLLSLIFSSVWLLCAFFTKESGLLIAPAVALLLVALHHMPLFSKRSMILYACWFIMAVCWFMVRSSAQLANTGFEMSDIGANFLRRLPVLLQYYGKALLPFNLNVFPMMEETSYVFGFAAVLLTAVLIYFAPAENRRSMWGGFAWFFILLLPVVLLPASLNEQDFEHRLYVPMAGLIIVLATSGLFNRQSRGMIISGAVILVFVFINVPRQQHFKDPVTFWEEAVEGTPGSGYATMMLASRLEKQDKARADALMRHAYQLDPKEKYINFYMGKYYLDNNDPDSAEICLNEELNISAYYETWFQLSRLAFLRNDFEGSRKYMEIYLEKNPGDLQASGNYVLLLLQLNDSAAANAFIEKKQKEGMQFPAGLLQEVKNAQQK